MGKPCIAQSAKQGPRRWRIGAFDFETNGLDGDVVYGTLQYEVIPELDTSMLMHVYTADDMYDLLWEHNYKKMRWYAHNLEFDLFYLIQIGRERQILGELDNIVLYERGLGNVFKAEFCRGDEKLTVYDSMALWGGSLESFAKSFSTEGSKLKLDFDIESFDIYNPAHIEYAKQDTRALLSALINFDAAVYEIFGTHVKGTISGTALSAWEISLDPGIAYWRMTETVEDYCRAAYKGGLVFLDNTREHNNITSLDVNSMYPHCMRKYGVPVGTPEYVTQLKLDRPGVYNIRVKTPEHIKFGCLGYKYKESTLWPRGDFETTAFSFEIERAKSWGYIIEIIDGYTWFDIDYPFNNFVSLCEEKRAQYKGQPFETVVKLIQNSVYGKFGTKLDGTELVIFPPDADIPDEWSPHIMQTESGAECPFGLVHEKKVKRDSYYINPHWAGWITAQARGILLDAYTLANGCAIYGDTDSIKLPKELAKRLISEGKLDGSADYGGFKNDGDYTRFRAVAPKVYVYCDDAGKFGGTGKGIPKKMQTSEYMGEIFGGKKLEVSFEGLTGFKAGVKSGKREIIKRTRTSSDLKNSRGWFETIDGEVYAVKIVDGKPFKNV